MFLNSLYYDEKDNNVIQILCGIYPDKVKRFCKRRENGKKGY